jgi:hypothetical protein
MMQVRAGVIAIAAFSASSWGGVAWTFDADDEGWGTLNDAREFAWDGSIGQPAGAIRARDIGDGRIWYFSAPSAALGDLSNLYGGEISWDILGIQGNQASFGDRADVMLVGAGISIGLDTGVAPTLSGWESTSAQVDVASGWRLVSSLSSGALTTTAATEAQILAVLGDLQAMYIQGEYTNGADRSAIDNVSFVPAPGAAALLGLGLAGSARRRR